MDLCKMAKCGHRLMKKEDLVLLISLHFSTTPVCQKTRFSMKKIRELQLFQRSSEALYGRTLTRTRKKTRSPKAIASGLSETSNLNLDSKLIQKTSKSDSDCLNTISDTIENSNETVKKQGEKAKNGGHINVSDRTNKGNLTSQNQLKVTPLDMERNLKEAIESISSFSLQGVPEKDFCFSQEVNKYLSGMKKNPSVGTILQDTMSEESKDVLERWMKKMITKLGEQGFLDYKNALFENGHNFHAYLGSELTKSYDVNLKPENEPLMTSVGNLLNDISVVELVESRVVHDNLGYMGILDGVVRYRDELVLVEWKTSDKQKDRLDLTYDNPLQVAAYMGALNSDPTHHMQVSKGLLVIAYRDGRPASVHPMSPQQSLYYWQFWLLRLQKYWHTKLNLQ